ncbi:Aspartic proteinase CDR1 [Linum perenne]
MCIVFEAQSQYRGFSTDLIHRDSSSSPFYNSQETPAQRIHNAARRSIARVHRFSNIIHHITHELDDPNALLTANNGEYLVNISLGTPPFPIVAIADTGSDIIWTQCKPCANCYKQDAPLFDPKSSSTYKTVSCSSNACNSLQSDGSSCSSNGQVCQYQVSYGDQSHTQGDVASETLTLASTAVPKTIIGCGHDNAGTFDSKGSGIVGLGGGSASLVSQHSNIKVPPVTVHFQGADLAMTPDNIFIHVSDKIMCLAFYANDELSIYGNVAQQNFLIGYDLQKHTISFKPTDCSKTTA